MKRFFQSLGQKIYWQLLALSLMLAALVVLSSSLGYMRISFYDVLRIVLAKLLGMDSLLDGVNSLFPVVITDVRLPRILTAAAVGAGLALSGVVFQGILLNPLADPYTLGVSAGAALGASFALWLNIGIWGIWSVPLFAFIGSGLTLMAVIYLASSSSGLSSSNLILSGIIVSAILSAGVSFIKYMVDEQVSVIIFWLMGSFGSKTWSDVWLTLGALGAGLGSLRIFFQRDERDGPRVANRRIPGRGYPKSPDDSSDHRIAGFGRLRVGIGNYRIRGAAGAPYHAHAQRTGQPAADPGLDIRRRHSAAGRGHPDPGRAAARNPHRGADRTHRRAFFLLYLPETADWRHP